MPLTPDIKRLLQTYRDEMKTLLRKADECKHSTLLAAEYRARAKNLEHTTNVLQERLTKGL